jgi:hypothetical protein
VNNSNGAALIARIRAGSTVTIRDHRGAMVTGKAKTASNGAWLCRTSYGFAFAADAGNVTRVQP